MPFCLTTRIGRAIRRSFQKFAFHEIGFGETFDFGELAGQFLCWEGCVIDTNLLRIGEFAAEPGAGGNTSESEEAEQAAQPTPFGFARDIRSGIECRGSYQVDRAEHRHAAAFRECRSNRSDRSEQRESS